MPRYDYLCTANGRTVEVLHPITQKLSTWGELCLRAGLDPGPTPPEAPVQRILAGGMIALPRRSGRAGGCGDPSCDHSGHD